MNEAACDCCVIGLGRACSRCFGEQIPGRDDEHDREHGYSVGGVLRGLDGSPSCDRGASSDALVEVMRRMNCTWCDGTLEIVDTDGNVWPCFCLGQERGRG